MTLRFFLSSNLTHFSRNVFSSIENLSIIAYYILIGVKKKKNHFFNFSINSNVISKCLTCQNTIGNNYTRIKNISYFNMYECGRVLGMEEV